MGVFKEQAKGAGQRVKGTVKEAAGKAVGNPRLQVEGNLEKNIGKVRQAAARPMEALKGAVQEATGTAKRAMGEIARDPGLAGQGEVERVAGKVRRKANE